MADGIKRIKIEKTPLRDQILPFLRTDLISNRWKPGERLSEAGLCEEYGISRTPLREAFKALEGEGLIVLLPNVGAMASDMNHPELVERFEAMSRIEEIAAVHLAWDKNPDALRRIEEIHNGMRVAAARGDTQEYYRLNDEFHRSLVLVSGNRILADFHNQLMMHVHRARHWANVFEPLDVEAQRNHDPIVAAIMQGDSIAAGQAVRRHLRDVSGKILRKIIDIDKDGARDLPLAGSAGKRRKGERAGRKLVSR